MLEFLPLCIVKDAFAYRFRGGGFIATGHNWIVRIIWGHCLLLSYLLLKGPEVEWLYAAAIIPLAYITMLVPHAFCQNIGLWPIAQKRWPAFFQVEIEKEDWEEMPFWERALYDMFSMAGVAFFRSLILFGPLLALENLDGRTPSLAAVAWAMGIVFVGQPLAYFAGWKVPFTFGASLRGKSTEWAEFFNGAVWALAFAAL